MSSSPSVEDVRELLQHIQLRLPLIEATRTSVLSKSWLHAWTTIPTLRFSIGKRKLMNLADMERTLIRYLTDNLPIESFDLNIEIWKPDSASRAEKCIRTTVATKKSTLKELSLTFYLQGASINLPDEILSCENLTKLRVLSTWGAHFYSLYMTSHHPVVTIKCVSLRELYLNRVKISQELLDGILSSCRLLAKVELINCSRHLNIIKVQNLPCLDELTIATEDGGSTHMEINDVPNLRVFTCSLIVQEGQNPRVPFNAHSISLGSSLMELSLIGVVTDDTSLDMIKLGVPLLESLTLDMASWDLESFHFTSASIKRLSLQMCRRRLTDVQVFAPDLLFFRFHGNAMPRLLFPISTQIKETRFKLTLRLPVDASFFLKMREALALSSHSYVYINLSHDTLNHGLPPWNINIDDLRTSLTFPPAMNVQLSFQTCWDEREWEHYPFFDALFEICRPKHITAMHNLGSTPKNYFCKLMLREVLENNKTTKALWRCDLKRVKIGWHKNWETLSNSHRSFLDGQTPIRVHFKLEWR